jgi:hypothetical protein
MEATLTTQPEGFVPRPLVSPEPEAVSLRARALYPGLLSRRSLRLDGHDVDLSQTT